MTYNETVSVYGDTMGADDRIAAIRAECGPEPAGSSLYSTSVLPYNPFTGRWSQGVGYYSERENPAHEAYLKMARLSCLDLLNTLPAHTLAELRAAAGTPTH